MRLFAARLFSVALIASLSYAGHAPTNGSSPFHWSGHVSSGRTIEIRNINGSIRAEHTSGPDVEVLATRTARRGNADDVQIRVVPKDGGYMLCAVYPGDSEDCHGGRHHTRNNDTIVEFTVRVPSAVRFTAKSVNGPVYAEDLRSDVDADTVNGKIQISTMGNARASSVNGSIFASMGRLDTGEPPRFHTVNGSIDLNLPTSANADLHASTVNGSISTDFPVTIHGRFGPKSITGRIGDGGGELSISTVNGSIHLRHHSVGVV